MTNFKIKDGFSFGNNWYNYVQKHLSDERIGIAKKSLSDFLGMDNFEGKSFLDIGCGSGIFSYAAYIMGAKEILSFDVDRFSIKSCEVLYERAKRPNKWIIKEGSILDGDFINTLDPYDIVYSWGVLHHTGDMWTAIKNASKLIKPNGLFYLAIYNKYEKILFNSDFWLFEKRFYNKVPTIVKRLLEAGYMTASIIYYLVTFRNPIKRFKDYKTRGMSWYIDLKDWLGGYPYEFASPDEISSFCQDKLGLKLLKVKPTVGLGNNEFLFKA